MKKCTKCSELKPSFAFSKNTRLRSGLRSWCKACAKESLTAWRNTNSLAWADYQRTWRKEHPEKVRRYNQSEGVKNANLVYRKNNLAKHAAYQSRREAAKLKATPPWADAVLISEVYAFAQEFREAGFDVEVDHALPLRGKNVCGLHVEHNLRVVLARHNKVKHNKVLEYIL
jgi:hypothetical protein